MQTEPYIPTYITVHLGAPNDKTAANVTIPYVDYLKNVASSELYPTWPESALRANILAENSFALNRIYTEWYRNQEKDFDITSTTAYDQAFVNGRETFANVDALVDELFDSYIVQGDHIEPLAAHYCNGTTTKCDGLSQWGSVALAKEGLGAYDILARYYGDQIDLVTNAPIRAPFASYPGYPLAIGSAGNNVLQKQIQLNRISVDHSSIPKIYPVDGVFGQETSDAVTAFQEAFNLVETGIIDEATWYRISYVYVAVKRLSELNSEGLALQDVSQQYPSLLRLGDTGQSVKVIQYYLAVIGQFYPEVPPTVTVTGTFDEQTEEAVLAVQQTFGLETDGIVGPKTWDQMYRAYKGIVDETGGEFSGTVLFPGEVLRLRSQGEDVRLLQEYLQTIAEALGDMPVVAVTGMFGNQTDEAVRAVQERYGLPVNGIVGPVTWELIAGLYRDITEGFEQQIGQYPGYVLEEEEAE